MGMFTRRYAEAYYILILILISLLLLHLFVILIIIIIIGAPPKRRLTHETDGPRRSDSEGDDMSGATRAAEFSPKMN
jgi:hypothetical protein